MGAPRRTFPGKKPGVWPYSRGLKGPLSAVWDSNLRSWCLKTIRQRPPSLALGHPTLAPDGLRLARPLPTRLAPWGEACAEWAHAGVGQGPGWSWVGHAEWKTRISRSALLPGAVRWRQARSTQCLGAGGTELSRGPGSRGQKWKDIRSLKAHEHQHRRGP